MHIVADENIPFAHELFSLLGNVTLKPGRQLNAKDVQHAEALLVRSVTPVDDRLLSGSRVHFVGTCTIGVDHLDSGYLREKDIAFASAPGCNANAVVQYVFSALAQLDALDTRNRVGIIGCGNVGGRLHRQFKRLGFDCVCVDPYLTKAHIADLASLDSIYDCDIVCMHTPRTRGGQFPTESLLNGAHFPKLKKNAILLNAGRGECINNQDLNAYLECHNDLRVVLDVWSGEPDINTALFSRVAIGTPHIAGYSFEGRVNGSTMIFRALSQHLGKSTEWIDSRIQALEQRYFGDQETVQCETLSELVLRAYPIERDHLALQAALTGLPSSFDLLRKAYPKRRELSHFYNDRSLIGPCSSNDDPLRVLGCSRDD